MYGNLILSQDFCNPCVQGCTQFDYGTSPQTWWQSYTTLLFAKGPSTKHQYLALAEPLASCPCASTHPAHFSSHRRDISRAYGPAGASCSRGVTTVEVLQMHWQTNSSFQTYGRPSWWTIPTCAALFLLQVLNKCRITFSEGSAVFADHAIPFLRFLVQQKRNRSTTKQPHHLRLLPDCCLLSKRAG